MSAYDRMTDEQLIEKLRGGDRKIMDYIMEKYKNLVRKEANAMYLLGGENEDLIRTWCAKKPTPCIFWAGRTRT